MLYIIMTKYALKRVLNKFKQKGKSAFTKEITQLHSIESFFSVDATKITKKKE